MRCVSKPRKRPRRRLPSRVKVHEYEHTDALEFGRRNVVCHFFISDGSCHHPLPLEFVQNGVGFRRHGILGTTAEYRNEAEKAK